MTHTPRTVDNLYQALRDNLKDQIAGLTNFTDTSFNYIWTQAFSEELRDLEVQVLDAELAGWIDYAGGPITEDQLETLGVGSNVDPEDLGQEDVYLDELVKIVGVTRDPGEEASGQVTFTVDNTSTQIPEGTRVGTQPDADGDFLTFRVDADGDGDVTGNELADGASGSPPTLTVDVIADDVGTEYNVGSGTVTYLPSPPTGVQSVTNNSAIEGGEDEETNDELRERAKNAIFESSGGGTVEGIIGYIESEVDNVDEAEIIEFFTGDTWHGSYPHSHVIVDGGTDSDVETAIDESRPAGVQHVLIRPTTYDVRVDTDLEGTDIDTSRVESEISEYIASIGLNEELVDSKLIQLIMNADDDIEDIPTLEIYIEGEDIFYDSATDIYELNFSSLMQDDGVTSVTGTVDSSSYTFTEGADFDQWNTGAGDTTTPQDAVNFDSPDVAAVADDGGAQTTETTEANESTADDMTLLPAAPATGDAYYFGADASFEYMELNVSTAGAGTWTITWEYWDGSSWSALSNVTDNTNGFTVGGNNSISWDEPNDFATTSVNGIGSKYWVRGRVSAFTSINTQPLGQEANLGQVPDVNIGETETLTYESGTDQYIVDDAMITDGITQIDGTLSGIAHTFTEGVDYEEVDVRSDGVINGVDWSIGGDSPDADTDFTVTYDAGTAFEVTYILDDLTDISFTETSKPDPGTINVTVV